MHIQTKWGLRQKLEPFTYNIGYLITLTSIIINQYGQYKLIIEWINFQKHLVANW